MFQLHLDSLHLSEKEHESKKKVTRSLQIRKHNVHFLISILLLFCKEKFIVLVYGNSPLIFFVL